MSLNIKKSILFSFESMKIIWVVCNLIIMSATQSILFFTIFSKIMSSYFLITLKKTRKNVKCYIFIQELQLRPSVNKIKYELLLFPFVGEYNYTQCNSISWIPLPNLSFSDMN